MKTNIFKLKTLLFSTVCIAMASCDDGKDFPTLVETGVNLDNYDIILVKSGDVRQVTATFKPNIVPQRDYKWTVDNPSVASLVVNADKSVSLTATGSGETTLRITAADDNTITAASPVKVISGPPVDITSQASITANKENSGGPNANEGSLKLVDGKLNTKYLAGYSAPFYLDLNFAQPVIVGYYSMTSGNDAPDRDPKEWQIEGSQDGVAWVVLDSRKDYKFPDRSLTREFYFKNNTAYKYYRLNVIKNNGGSLFQMQEWRLFNLPN